MSTLRECQGCRKSFPLSHYNSKRKQFCSAQCKSNYNRVVRYDALPQQVSKGDVGAAAEMLVAAHLLMEGWAVFRSVSPTSYCDLIAVRNGVIRHIEVRSTSLRRIDGSPSFSQQVHGPMTTEFAVVCEGEITFHPVEHVNLI